MRRFIIVVLISVVLNDNLLAQSGIGETALPNLMSPMAVSPNSASLVSSERSR